MNRETVMTTLDYYQDDHTAFYHWMAGYMCGTEDGPGYIHVDENGKESPIGFSGEEKDDDGWIKHDGGPCPVYPGSMVMVRSRNGAESGSLLAKVVAWRHRNGDWDTVAYKVVTPTVS